MARAKALGNDQIERLADSLFGGEAKQPGRCRIPKNNLTVGARGDDRIGGGMNKSFQI